jgi:hypothetical protein
MFGIALVIRISPAEWQPRFKVIAMEIDQTGDLARLEIV